MGAAALLTFWGAFRNAWEAPFIMLMGYVGTRIVVQLVNTPFLEVSICALWLCVAAVMVYRGFAIPGLLLTFSALSYPVFLTFGLRLEYMAITPIVADIFAVCAMVWIGGTIYGSGHHSRSDNLGNLGGPLAYQEGVAKSCRGNMQAD